MTLTRKDTTLTALTALAVLVYLASAAAWDLWAIGTIDHSLAAAINLVLGAAVMATASRDDVAPVYGWLGFVGVTLGFVSLFTGSATWLALFTAAIVVLWAVAEVRHIRHEHATRRPSAATGG